MQITTKAWRKYIDQMSAISKKAADEMQAWIRVHGFADDQALLEYAYALASHYGEAIGALSCQMYEATAAAQSVTVAAAEPAELPNFGEVAKAVNGTRKQSLEKVAATVGRLVKQVGADTTLKNAERDGAQFAWIPSGDTCAFCLTLASRGWQYMSKKTLKNGHAEHIHANCDCQYAIRFDGKSTVEGYDPDALREKYDSFSGSPKDKIRQWQNEFREAHKDEINARKRELYNDPKNRMLRLAKQGNIFVMHTEDLAKYAEKIEPIEGYTDIVAHGDEFGIAFRNYNGIEENISAEEFCEIIEKGGTYKGGKIRLLACKTGSGDGIVPTYMAKRFNTEVLAPTEIVNVDFDGNIILADNETNAKMGIETGKWVKFNKDGKIEE